MAKRAIRWSVWQRGDSPNWYYRIFVNGRKAEGDLSTHETDEGAAKVFVAKRVAALSDAAKTGIDPVKLSALGTHYFATRVEPAPNMSAHSKSTYVSMLGIITGYFLQPTVLGQDVLVSEIKATHVGAFKAWLVRPIAQADGSTKPARKPSSANKLLGLLRSMLNLAKDELHGLTEVPPVVLFPEDTTPYAVIEYAEEERLLQGANENLRDLLVFCADTSLRRGEALRLEFHMIMWSEDEAVRRTYVVVPPHIRKWKKGKPLRLALTARALEIVRRRFAAAPDKRAKLFPYSVDDGQTGRSKSPAGAPHAPKRSSPVPGGKVYGVRPARTKKGGFYVVIRIGEDDIALGWVATIEEARAKRLAAEEKHWGKPSADVGLAQAWKQAKRHAGITRRIRFHDLRHTAATRLLNAGVHVKHVQKLLGHSDIETTMRYLHDAEGYEDEAMTRLEGQRQAAMTKKPIQMPKPKSIADDEEIVLLDDGDELASAPA